MLRPGSDAESERGPGPPRVADPDPLAIAPAAAPPSESGARPSKKELLAALHRDFDDARDLSFGEADAGGDAWAAALPTDPTLPPPAHKTPWTPLQWVLTGLAIVLIAQVPLIWAFTETSAGEGPAVYTCADLGTPRAARMTPRERVQLEIRCNPNAHSVQTFIRADDAQAIPEDAQVVETDQPEAVDPKPVETKYLAEVTTRADKETRAKAVARPDRRRGARAPNTPAETAANAESPAPTTAPPEAPRATRDEAPVDVEGEPDKAKGPELPPRIADIMHMPRGDVGEPPPPRPMERGQGGGGPRILMPATSEDNVLANIRALAGEHGTNDHLPDVEPGERTVLNANSYKYADFFHTVKRAVERHWRPSEVYMRRDPTGQVYGVKDRYTVLRVELDRQGAIVSLIVSRPSGLDFMDEEAKRAFSEAQPFPNPPLGLADTDGRIRFEFGFFFEITGGRYRFNWRRL